LPKNTYTTGLNNNNITKEEIYLSIQAKININQFIQSYNHIFDLGLYQDWKTYSNLRFKHRGDLLMGIMLIVELSQFIPNRIFDLQINQSLLINQLELLIEQFSQSPNWILNL
jgi:hypothetical protein